MAAALPNGSTTNSKLNASNGRSQPRPHPKAATQPEEQKLQCYTGFLITCDAALKTFLLRLNRESGYQFVKRDLDPTHLFVSNSKFPPQFAGVHQWLEHKVRQWATKYTYDEETGRVDD